MIQHKQDSIVDMQADINAKDELILALSEAVLDLQYKLSILELGGDINGNNS